MKNHDPRSWGEVKKRLKNIDS